IDLVFAEAVVDGLHTTCSYDGIEAERALECLLDGTGLRAERVRHRQYVLVAPQTAGSGEPVRRITLSGFVVDEQTGEALPGAHDCMRTYALLPLPKPTRPPPTIARPRTIRKYVCWVGRGLKCATELTTVDGCLATNKPPDVSPSRR